MSRAKSRNKKINKKIAKTRIIRLFDLAEKFALNDRLRFSDRYVFLARKISMRYLVPIPIKYKRKYCKNCYSFLLPGKNCRIRIQGKKIVFYCHNCKKYMRFPIRNKNKQNN
jgi:ribonuclease P protein subunit RPR2